MLFMAAANLPQGASRYIVRCVGTTFFIMTAVMCCESIKYERPSFELQKMAFHRVKGCLSHPV